MLIVGSATADEESGVTAVSASRILLFLPFSVIYGTASTILYDSKINRAAAVFIHALLLTVGGYLCLILPVDAENGASGADRFMHFVFAVLIYAVIFLLVFLVRRGFKKALEADRQYRDPKN